MQRADDPTSDVTIAAVDVGSVANIGWWAERPSGPASGRDLDGLVECVASELNSARSVALGFEAPLYVPLPDEAVALNRQRTGERGRPWCAGAGTGALAMGAQQSAYVFAQLAQRIATTLIVSFDPADLALGGTLVIWEAFVTAKAKDRTASDPHVDDARVAVAEFASRLASGTVYSDIEDASVFNIVAGSLIAAGLASDIGLLSQPCIVVRAPDLPAH